MKNIKITSLITLSLFATINLYAVEIPNIGDVLKEVTPPKIEKEKKVLPPLQSEDEEYKKVFEDGKKVYVKSFLIHNAIHMPNKELKTIVKPYEKKELSFKDIQDIINMITLKYRQKGYFVARAYLPVQDLQKQESVLKISVIEGEYSEFKLNNSSLVKDSILQENLDEIKNIDQGVISTKSLQRGLLIINDTPGVSISSTQIKPGKEVGTSDFIIGTSATNRYDGYLLADNYGSEYTGEHRVMAGVNINSPFNIGDKISLSALSSQNAGLLNGSLAYGFPILSNGLRGEVSFSKTTYELGSTYKELDALGSSNSIIAKLSYPLIRSNDQNLETYFKTSYNKMEDKINSTSTTLGKDTIVAVVGVDYSKESIIFNKYLQSNINFYLTTGRLSFDTKEDKQNDEDGANTNGNFSKVNLEIAENININEYFRWENSLQLQYALGNKNLDGSQDLSIGGINGVKLYPQGEQSAENGYVFNTELFYTLPQIKNLNSKISIFYDIAKVKMSKNITNEENSTYQDAGIGYYAYYKDFFINSHLAYKVGNSEINSEDDYNSKFMFQAGWVF
ncbi:ShlB/FhaC/HecB family hemolysin secretion/activation protein [Campylobacterota bacterium DY0563]